MPLDDVLAGYQRGGPCWRFAARAWQAVQEQIKVLDDCDLAALRRTIDGPVCNHFHRTHRVRPFFDLSTWSAQHLQRVEQALEQWIDPHAPANLGQAMRYAVLGAGKRLRPLLVLAACEAVGRPLAQALRAACAVELIHAYSLVHDDMPCMDNDVLRRGKPTVHVQFGAGPGVVGGRCAAGAGLLSCWCRRCSAASLCAGAVVPLAGRCCGLAGMAGGQAIDLASVGQPLSEAQLRHMHRLKTGALLQCSVDMGAACAVRTRMPKALGCAQAHYRQRPGFGFSGRRRYFGCHGPTRPPWANSRQGRCQRQSPTYVSLLALELAVARAQALRATSPRHACAQCLARYPCAGCAGRYGRGA